MTPENKHVASDQIKQVPLSSAPPDRAMVALVRIGTRRCRLAAAFMAVVVGFASQIGNQAVAQAKQSTLYLDAPVVSTERAAQAGDAASAYSTSDSRVSSETLTWLGIPARSVHVSSPSEGAEQAFTSITESDGEEAGGVTVAAARRAGQVMLAQVQGSPSEEGDAEPLSEGAVRPQLGDGKQTPKTEPEADGPDDAREEQPSDAGSTSADGVQAYASTPGTFSSGGEPSGAPGVVIPAPAEEEAPDEGPRQATPAEVVSTRSDTSATPPPGSGTDEEPFGPTGPVSDAGRTTSPTAGSTEDGDDGIEQPPPDEGAPTSEEAAPDAGEGELTGVEPTVEETGPTSGEGDRVVLVPVSPLSAEEETATTEGISEADDVPASTIPPVDAGGSETAYAEPPSPEETPEDTSAGTDTPRTISTELSDDGPGEERVAIVVVVEEAPPTETPSQQPAAEHSPTGQARPEEVLPEASPGQEASGGGTPPEGGTPQDDDTEQGQPPPEEPPAEQVPAGGESAVEQPPNDVQPDEAQPAADDGSPPAGGTGVRGDAPPTPREDRQPGGEQTEDSEDGAVAPPDNELSENPNDPPEETVAPPPGDQVHDVPQQGGRDEHQDQDPQKDSGPQGDKGGPEARPTDAVEQVEEDDGGGEPIQENPQDHAAAPEGGGAIQQEQTVIVEVGEPAGGMTVPASSPEPPAQDAPREPEELVAADPAPQASRTPVPSETEEPSVRQDAAGQARADRQTTPESVTGDRTPAPEAGDDSPEDGSGRRSGFSGATQKP